MISRDPDAALAHLPLRPRQEPLPRPSTTGFKPVTFWASNAASVVDAFNTCAAEPVASASLSAARASASDASRCVSEEATACFSACSTHSRQRCFPTPLASCVRLNASAASVFPHAEHTCCSVGGGGGGGGSAFGPSVGTGAAGNVSATEAFAACFAAATARSSAAAASTHSLQRIGACSSLRALSSILLLKLAAINRFRPHGPAQLNSDAHDMVPVAARAPREQTAKHANTHKNSKFPTHPLLQSYAVSQFLSYFTVPPRAHPSAGTLSGSAGSPSGSAAPGLTQVPSVLAPGGY